MIRPTTWRSNLTSLPMSGPFLRKMLLALCVGNRPYPIGRDDAVRAQSNLDLGVFLARVFAIVHEAGRDGVFSRLKACPNCHWAFWDASKNRSATWCSMELCGNRLKTKRYRSRHAQANEGPVRKLDQGR